MEVVELITLDEIVGAEAGLVYSTQPRRAQAEGGDYFVKGPDAEVVFAELAGCLLASKVGIPVAPAVVCSFCGTRYAGSRKVADIGRNITPWLRRPERIVNFAILYHTIVVDTWLANDDRNMGNVLGRGADGGRMELVMIDYEKSATLRNYPLTKTPTVAPSRLWPTGELGQMLRQQRPLHPPTPTMDRIRALAEKASAIEDIVGEVTAAYGPIEWTNNSVEALRWRGARITQLVGEVWEAA